MITHDAGSDRQLLLTRRVFLADMGKVMGAAIVGTWLTACSSPDSVGPAPPTGEDAAVMWRRADLDFVSAYVLARDGEAALVDTGTRSSAGVIQAALGSLNLGWDAVGHVILTHLHGDHIGGLPEVMIEATDAQGYAGEADIAAIEQAWGLSGSQVRPLQAIGDGDDVFGLEIISTPGHTPGHVSVLDPVGGLLVAGDALNGAGSGVVGPNPSFTEDMDQANESVRKLAEFSYETAVFGHGDPVISGADELVAALAAVS